MFKYFSKLFNDNIYFVGDRVDLNVIGKDNVFKSVQSIPKF